MKSSEKQTIIDSLTKQVKRYNHFYLTDISGLNAEETSDLRRRCFKQDVKLVVVKNTLLRKALERSGKDASGLYDILKGSTSVMFCDTGNVPAKLIKDFKKNRKKTSLKGAFVEESVYLGDDQLDILEVVKTKNEIVADLVALLQSPIQTVLSQLQTGGNILHGVLKTLGEKE
jgi:large subunit ribosomal protein L10